MLVLSTIMAQMSGSVAGATAARNKGGQYLRSRSLVIQPSTSFQVAARNAMKALTARWATLSNTQRASWKTYAINTPITNRLGQSKVIPDLAMYLRCNAPRLIAIGSAAIVDSGPTTFGLGVLTAPTFTMTAPNSGSVAYTNTDAWATTTGGYLFVQFSRAKGATIIFPSADFRLAGHVSGNTGTPPTSPAAITSPFQYTAGQQVFARFRASNADGRLSGAQTLNTLAV